MSTNAVTTQQKFDLSDKHAIFVKEIASGAKDYCAAATAGYIGESARTTAWRLLREPRIMAAIQFEVRRRLIGMAPVALSVLETLMTAATSEKVRADCAKTLLDRAGLIAPRAAAPGTGDKPLHEMAVTELRAMADKLQGEIEARARPVNAPNAPSADGQVVDMIG